MQIRRRALVTGATGFLGQRLVRHLLDQGVEVRCLVRPTSNGESLPEALAPGQSHRLEIFEGTLGRIDCCEEAVTGCDIVFHLAASLSGPSAVLFMDNVVATRKLIELLGRCPIRRFVLVSSLAVYGTSHLRAGDLLDEQCPLDTEPHRRDPYTYSKIAQEKVAWEAYRGGTLPLVVVRPGVIYGPGRDCLTNRVGLRFGSLLLQMGGKQPLPYTQVDNCAQAVALAGTAPGVEGEAFNVVDDCPPTGRQLLRQYRQAVRPLRVLPVFQLAIGPLSRLCETYHRCSAGQLPAVLTRYQSMAQWKPLRYSNAKAKVLLGWQPKIAFSEGLQQTFAWLRQQDAASTMSEASA